MKQNVDVKQGNQVLSLQDRHFIFSFIAMKKNMKDFVLSSARLGVGTKEMNSKGLHQCTIHRKNCD